MSFWEKFKEFDRMMSEPAVIIRTEKTITIPQPTNQIENNQVTELIEEVAMLRAQLESKKVNAIDTTYKLIE